MEIGESAFEDCTGLTSINIPDDITILDGTFIGCTNLESVTIPDRETEIGDLAFEGCENITVICPKNSFAWKYCKENGIEVEASAGSSGGGLFGKLFG